MMKAHTTTVKMEPGGKIVLDNLPFAEGEEVEVTVQPAAKPGRPWPPEFPLKGSVIRYDDPFEPACPPEEWEAIGEASEC